MHSSKLKFVFLHPHKCGGNTINRLFSPYSDVELITRDSKSGKKQGSVIPDLPNCKHATYKPYVKAFPEIKNYFKFSVFRNPYDRVASWYSHKTQKKKPVTLKEAKKFVKSISSGGVNKMPAQVEYYGLDGENFLDFVIDFDNFEKDLIEVYEKIIGIKPKEVPVINKSPMEKPDDFYIYEGKLSLELKESVYQLFDRDFKFMKDIMQKSE